MSYSVSPMPQKILITDLARFSDWRAALARLSAGDGVILRDYDHPHRIHIANEMARLCASHGLRFFIGKDWRLAWRLKANLHMPEFMADHPAPPLYHGRIRLVAAHEYRTILRAAQSGAQGVLISPVFSTAKTAAPLGVLRFQTLARTARKLRLTPYALGGMDEKQARRLHAPHFAAIRTLNHPFTIAP